MGPSFICTCFRSTPTPICQRAMPPLADTPHENKLAAGEQKDGVLLSCPLAHEIVVKSEHAHVVIQAAPGRTLACHLPPNGVTPRYRPIRKPAPAVACPPQRRSHLASLKDAHSPGRLPGRAEPAAGQTSWTHPAAARRLAQTGSDDLSWKPRTSTGVAHSQPSAAWRTDIETSLPSPSGSPDITASIR